MKERRGKRHSRLCRRERWKERKGGNAGEADAHGYLVGEEKPDRRRKRGRGRAITQSRGRGGGNLYFKNGLHEKVEGKMRL